ncbi:hypothetical protein [Microbacterium testaceum]|uniref:hypothetical protein n=1 Tax=Microbacterium testaceum TaxID=2033 RepID=UPI002AC55598|nr:hypothetical protein [Microbacterium testaceum]MDZ5146353.1 hypothetical protein [Microbacterium testaceum]
MIIAALALLGIVANVDLIIHPLKAKNAVGLQAVDLAVYLRRRRTGEEASLVAPLRSQHDRHRSTYGPPRGSLGELRTPPRQAATGSFWQIGEAELKALSRAGEVHLSASRDASRDVVVDNDRPHCVMLRTLHGHG